MTVWRGVVCRGARTDRDDFSYPAVLPLSLSASFSLPPPRGPCPTHTRSFASLASFSLRERVALSSLLLYICFSSLRAPLSASTSLPLLRRLFPPSLTHPSLTHPPLSLSVSLSRSRSRSLARAFSLRSTHRVFTPFPFSSTRVRSSPIPATHPVRITRDAYAAAAAAGAAEYEKRSSSRAPFAQPSSRTERCASYEISRRARCRRTPAAWLRVLETRVFAEKEFPTGVGAPVEEGEPEDTPVAAFDGSFPRATENR